MQEIWADIKGYEGLYKISSLGTVKALPNNPTHLKELILTPSKNSSGYLKVELYKDKVSKMYYVHRLVALTFIPNPYNKPQVNHKDGNKLNNTVENLEWVTKSENQKHAIKHGLRTPSPMTGKFGKLNHNSKSILQFDLNGNLIRKWDSISEAARYYGCNRNSISNVLLGYRKTCKGYVWKYDNSSQD